jgi:hypothetical protein
MKDSKIFPEDFKFHILDIIFIFVRLKQRNGTG